MSLNLREQYDPLPSQNPALKEWTKDGGRAIGYLCSIMPAEIIHAAGFFPLRILGNRKPIDQTREYLSNFSCYLIQSAFEEGLIGGYDLLDGFVVSFRCDCMRFLGAMWGKILQPRFYYFLNVPHGGHAVGSEVFFRGELKNFAESLEEFVGKKISDDSLKESIRLYNRLRACFRQIEALRDTSKISGMEGAEMVLYGLQVPPSQAVETLTQVIAAGDFKGPGPGPKVMVLGAEHPDLDIFKLIEEKGADIIADDICTVGRMAQPEISIMENDPLMSLSKFYLNEYTACPCMTTENRFQKRLDHTLKKVEQDKIKGVIFTIPRYCDPHQVDYPDLASALRERGIRTLLLDIEQSVYTAPIENRVEAFIEMLSE